MSSKSDGGGNVKGDVKGSGIGGGSGDAGKPNTTRPNTGNSGVSGIRKGQKRIKRVDARALENLIRWSLDLIERQQNLLKTALDVVTGDAEK